MNQEWTHNTMGVASDRTLGLFVTDLTLGLSLFKETGTNSEDSNLSEPLPHES